MPFFHRPLKRSPRPRPEGAAKLWNRMSSSLLVLPGRSGNDHREAQARRVRRWAVSGALCGGLAAAVIWAPAQWLATAVDAASEGRFQLADAQGSLWSGDAVLLLTAGPGAREARALPGRLGWRIAPAGAGLKVALQHACCLNGEVGLTLSAGLGRWSARLDPPPPGAAPAAGASTAAPWIGQWPAALLVGLGTPWNTLQPGGLLRLSGQNLSLEGARGRLALNGQVDLELQGFSSRLSTLPLLGSYRLSITGEPDRPGSARVALSTLEGALQLQGSGSIGPSGLRLRGEATAREADQPALNNLLNIIGRRDGARSLLSIG